jgi:hypothetical protein
VNPIRQDPLLVLQAYFRHPVRLQHPESPLAPSSPPPLKSPPYIVKTKSKKFILADHASERKVKTLLSRLRTMSKKEVEQLAKG